MRRWPLFLCLGQMILKCIATRVRPVQVPTLHGAWYEREETVGQGRRRLIAACHPRIARIKMVGAIQQKSTKAA